MKPHKHAEVIKAWADGARIEYFDDQWFECFDSPAWNIDTQYRVKPEPAYPETRMTSANLSDIYYNGGSLCDVCVAVANAAIRHAIDCGQVAIVEPKP